MIKMERNYRKILDRISKNIYKKTQEKDFDKAIKLVEIFATCAYNLNLFQTDDIIENHLLSLSEKLVKRRKSLDKLGTNQKRIIFFDSFGWDNRGLTQQYIKALIKNKYDFLFIFDNFELKYAKNILQELEGYNNCNIIKLEKKDSEEDNIKNLVKVIEQFEPTDAFLHLTPWCATSIIVWNSFKDINRYQVNLTDHAFWLGKNSFDYCIDFRNYGYKISTVHREIAKERIIKLPYYPIINPQNEFEGFPVEAKGKTIIVTGANYYKIFGEKDKYFKLLKKIYDDNQNIIILFAGGGDERLFKKILRRNKLEKIVHLIGDRSDISEVVRQADIYLASYPITGGLMGQFAVKSGIPAIGFSEKYIQMNQIESFLLETDVKLTFFDDESFTTEVNKMILDKKYRNDKALKVKDKIISESDFAKRLKDILEGTYDQEFEDVEIDHHSFQNLYLEVEKNYTQSSLQYLFENRYNLPDIKFKIEKMYYSRFPSRLAKNLLSYIKNRI